MPSKIFNSFKTFYSPKFPTLITYMLQTSEYRVLDYLIWFWKTDDFSKVQRRKELEKTEVAKLILLTLRIGILLQIFFGLSLIYLNIVNKLIGGYGFGLGIIVLYPVLWSHLICIPVFLARVLYINPKQKILIKNSKNIFHKSKALKIAVCGSYGKTSMKELLFKVFSSEKKVAATYGNKNVATSHASFAKSLDGDEEVLILEFGEGRPGDVYSFSETFAPDIAVITGISPAHLDKYKTMDSVAKDIFSVSKFVKPENVYVNSESNYLRSYLKNQKFNKYSKDGIGDFKVVNIKNDLSGLSFDLTNKSRIIKIRTKLLGRHQIGPLSSVAILAINQGISIKAIEKALNGIEPYEHRMSQYELNGAVIIDDSYNGNIEGIEAGCELLKELKANRKIYITPGLVDQGKETKNVHLKMGQLIAEANPDQVVLMDNSALKYIKQGLDQSNFKGKIQIEKDPLFYYNNLKHFVAKGDIVMMQNDWTDNYS